MRVSALIDEAPAVGACQRRRSSAPARCRTSPAGSRRGRGRAAAPSTSAASASVCGVPLRHDAGVHAQPASFAGSASGRWRTQSSQASRSGASRMSPRVSLRCSRADAVRHRQQVQVVVAEQAGRGGAQRAQSLQHPQRLGPAVDQVAQHDEVVARRRETASASRRSSASQQPCTSPIGQIMRRFCYAGRRCHPAPPLTGGAHGPLATRLPDPAQRCLRDVGDGAHREPQGAPAGDGRSRRAGCAGRDGPARHTRPSSSRRCRSASRRSAS